MTLNVVRDWERLRKTRLDVSQYVIHGTRSGSDIDMSRIPPYENLKRILLNGYLKPTFAVASGSNKPTVRGIYPAVCLTEQPLLFYQRSADAGLIIERYTKFGVAFRKDDLFDYGGRPVIYNTEDALGWLPDETKYLWVGYDPRDLWHRDYPNDWTHEREWRVRADAAKNQKAYMGSSGEGAVPLLLPTSRPPTHIGPSFVVLVDTLERAGELKEWIQSKLPEIRADSRHYWTQYAQALEGVTVLACDHVATVLKGTELGRLEDFFPITKASK